MKTHVLLFRALKLVWYQFAEMTSIHGLKFIMDKQGNVFTKLANSSISAKFNLSHFHADRSGL